MAGSLDYCHCCSERNRFLVAETVASCISRQYGLQYVRAMVKNSKPSLLPEASNQISLN